MIFASQVQGGVRAGAERRDALQVPAHSARARDCVRESRVERQSALRNAAGEVELLGASHVLKMQLTPLYSRTDAPVFLSAARCARAPPACWPAAAAAPQAFG